MTSGVQLLGIRVLEGPNLYFPRPAIKTTLDVSALLMAAQGDLAGIFDALACRKPKIGEPNSAVRDRAVMRLLEVVTRRIATASGTARLGIRVRHGEDAGEYVIAFPWNRLERGRALARSIPGAINFLLAGDHNAINTAARSVLDVEPGPRETMPKPKVPVISITGTNGKTTTTRLIAHISMCAGRKTAWSSTDGVLVQGKHVEHGDYSGPSGAKTVLATPGLEIAVLETARGGMLQRGMGVPYNDVSLVTNVTPDHLGVHGIDTVDQLAEVKAIITKVTRPQGWCVLNGDDPRVWAMRVGTPARPICFTLDPDAPCIREALAAHGKAFTVIDGSIVCIDERGMETLISLDDVPMTLSGLSTHNISNALAGAAGALALGLPRIAVVEGLRTFAPDASGNPGRMNVYTVPVNGHHVTVIIDMAHNEGGLEALLGVGRGLVPPGARFILGLGTGGDRTDEILENMGELAGRDADIVHIVHKEHYLRGRTMEDLESHLRNGLTRVGAHPVASWENEAEGLEGMLAMSEDGDVIAEMVHSHQKELHAWLMEHGATMDDPATIRRKVRAARDQAASRENVELDAESRVALTRALELLEQAQTSNAPSGLNDAIEQVRALLDDAPSRK